MDVACGFFFLLEGKVLDCLVARMSVFGGCAFFLPSFMPFVLSFSDSLVVENPVPSSNFVADRKRAERKICYVGKDEKCTHLQYILADFGDLGEELQGEDRADDAEAAGCDAAVLSFPSAVLLFLFSNGFFYLFLFFSHWRSQPARWERMAL